MADWAKASDKSDRYHSEHRPNWGWGRFAVAPPRGDTLASSRVIIEVSPSLLQVTVLRGEQVTGSRRHETGNGEWPASWMPALEALRTTLNEMVQGLACGGGQTTIVYHAPTTLTAVSSCAASAGRAASLTAAKLQLSSVAAFTLSANPYDACTLFRDAQSAASAGGGQLHTIAAADTEETVAALTSWAESAGLRVEGLIPAQAMAVVAATESLSAPKHGGPDNLQAALWLDRHSGVLVVGSTGRLHFVRTLSTGTESLVDALVKPMRSRGAAGEPGTDSEPRAVTLDRASAGNLLAVTGIPQPDQSLDGLPGFDGACVLPGLQPSLQRIAVEIKQSMRFGVSEEQRSGATLRLCGPGARIPGLAEAIGRLASIALAPADQAAPGNHAPSTTEKLHRVGSAVPLLRSRQTAERVLTRNLRKAMLCGVGVAAAFLAVSAAGAFAELDRERTRLAAVKIHNAGDAALDDVQGRTFEAVQSAASLRSRISERVGQAPEWSAALAAIARSMPGSIRVLDLSLSRGGGAGAAPTDTRTGSICTLRGYSRAPRVSEAAESIREFTDVLGRAAIIENVRLGATQRTMFRGMDVQTFELTIGLVDLPFDAKPTELSNADRTETSP